MIDPASSRALALKARLDGGEAISVSQTTWNVAGFCQKAKQVTVEARQYRGYRYSPEWQFWCAPFPKPPLGIAYQQVHTGHAHAVHLTVRCGNCAWCLAARRRLWTDRAKTECQLAERTWFITLTASPATQLEWTGRAYRRLEDGGTKPASLDEGEWYRERCKEAGRDLQLYMKRLRKQADSPLRALWVFEKHEGGGAHSGLPHIHGLLHESVDGAVKYRSLSSQWACGYIHAKVLTDESESVASYVSKCCGYLSKSTHVRIRASHRYGSLMGKDALTHRVDNTRQKQKGLTTTNVGGNNNQLSDTPNTGRTAVVRGAGERGESLSPLPVREAAAASGLRPALCPEDPGPVMPRSDGPRPTPQSGEPNSYWKAKGE